MSEHTAPTETPSFRDLGLPEHLLRVLTSVGYETPSPIQAATIPSLLQGRDVMGLAQTGTGKTAAFALPVLSAIEPVRKAPQALVLCPTRELAIQVAEAFQRYAEGIPGFNVLPIYGGAGYGQQLSALRRGVHVIVGTPGRVIDHIEKGTLDLSQIRHLVLDEADEMLRMGFIDDVETILKKTPESRQTALFSATMPQQVKRIAGTYLRDPVEVSIAAKTRTADKIRQRVWMVGGLHKLDAMTRILETEPFDAMIVFARTKVATEELAEKLGARGFAAAAINGDLAQAQRERTIQQLKDGKIDILVATDVAARGLDVERISHVLNYDVPYDTESYVHRIGRTGRAGRSGDAILFITPRERNLLRAIERTTRQPIETMGLPTVQAVNQARLAKFKQRIADALAGEGLEVFQSLVDEVQREYDAEPQAIAAALAKLLQGNKPLLLEGSDPKPFEVRERSERPERAERAERFERGEREERAPREKKIFPPKVREARTPDPGFETFRIEVGYEHGVKPGNIVGAIANEAGLDSKHIGRIEIFEDHSILDLPEGMPQDVMGHLKTVWCAGQQLRITRDGEPPDTAGKKPARKPFGKGGKSFDKPFEKRFDKGPRDGYDKGTPKPAKGKPTADRPFGGARKSGRDFGDFSQAFDGSAKPRKPKR